MVIADDLTSEIIFDEGENQLIKNPRDLTKKQIWFKAFQRCFDEGSKQMSIYKDINGHLVNQMEVFFNSVICFQIMSLGIIMEKKYESLFSKSQAINELIKTKKEELKTKINEIIIASNKQGSHIDVNKNIEIVTYYNQIDLVELYREQLALFSMLMEEEEYLDSHSGIKD